MPGLIKRINLEEIGNSQSDSSEVINYQPIAGSILGKKEKNETDQFFLRYRNKLGEDIAIEALKNYISEESADIYLPRIFLSG
ncbi:MAG: hypothetical protein NT166_23040 [Candidatus Aminicenantes bacterium]|nr:hypothetical protein [Candidatus Aminicenantes bacterium]